MSLRVTSAPGTVWVGSPSALLLKAFSAPYPGGEIWIVEGSPSRAQYVSRDAGVSWTQYEITHQALNDFLYDVEFDPANTAVKYLCLGVNEINLTRFTFGSPPISLNARAKEVAVSNERPGGLFTSEGKISVDGGHTWFDRRPPVQQEHREDVSLIPMAFHRNGLTVIETSRPSIFAGRTTRALVSADLGLSWKQTMNFGTVEVTAHYAEPTEKKTVLVATQGRGIARNERATISMSRDAGLSWREVYTLDAPADETNGPMITGLTALAPNGRTVYFAATARGLLKSDDDGDTWRRSGRAKNETHRSDDAQLRAMAEELAGQNRGFEAETRIQQILNSLVRHGLSSSLVAIHPQKRADVQTALATIMPCNVGPAWRCPEYLVAKTASVGSGADTLRIDGDVLHFASVYDSAGEPRARFSATITSRSDSLLTLALDTLRIYGPDPGPMPDPPTKPAPDETSDTSVPRNPPEEDKIFMRSGVLKAWREENGETTLTVEGRGRTYQFIAPSEQRDLVTNDAVSSPWELLESEILVHARSCDKDLPCVKKSIYSEDPDMFGERFLARGNPADHLTLELSREDL